MFQYR
jgi:hypothetical protein